MVAENRNLKVWKQLRLDSNLKCIPFPVFIFPITEGRIFSRNKIHLFITQYVISSIYPLPIATTKLLRTQNRNTLKT